MGLGSSIGKLVNSVTGATDAAQTNWKYQKQAMQNAHQWEVQDLTKAGLNPVYSANSQGASTGGVSPGMQPGGSGLFNSAITAMTESAKLIQGQKKIDAEVNNLDEDTRGKEIDNAWKDPLNQSLIEERGSKAGLNNAQAALATKQQELVNSTVGLNAAKKEFEKSKTMLNEKEAYALEQQIDKAEKDLEQLDYQYGLERDQIKLEQDYLNSKIGRTMWYVNRVATDAKPVAQSAAGIYGAYKGSKIIDKYLHHKPTEYNYTTIHNHSRGH